MRGFSIIDLLVSIAVMAVLIGILLPSLVMAQESARRVRCASNIRQIGIAIQSYAYENRDHLPPVAPESPSPGIGNRGSGDANDPGSNDFVPDDSDTMFLRLAPGAAAESSRPSWDGLGVLLRDDYLSHPGVFYCPSHHGEHEYRVYALEFVNGIGEIFANYQYRVPQQSGYLSSLDNRVSISADGMRTQSDYNHVDGNNFLRADLTVGWYNDSGRSLLNSLPQQPPHAGPNTTPSNAPWNFFEAERAN